MQAVNKTIKIQNLVLAYKCDHTSTDTNDHSIYITILAMKQDYWDECIVDGIKHKIIQNDEDFYIICDTISDAQIVIAHYLKQTYNDWVADGHMKAVNNNSIDDAVVQALSEVNIVVNIK